MNDSPSHLAPQVRISKALALGLVLTVWLLAWATLGVAVIVGVLAMSIIKQSQQPFAGKIITRWCIIVGSLQRLVLLSHITQVSLE